MERNIDVWELDKVRSGTNGFCEVKSSLLSYRRLCHRCCHDWECFKFCLIFCSWRVPEGDTFRNFIGCCDSLSWTAPWVHHWSYLAIAIGQAFLGNAVVTGYLPLPINSALSEFPLRGIFNNFPLTYGPRWSLEGSKLSSMGNLLPQT